jgi:phage virion morphogenesis protein
MSATTINSGVSLQIDEAARSIERHLALLAGSGPGMSADLRQDIGEYFLGQVQDRLDSQQLVDGSPMPQSQAAIDRDGKTLIDRHHLYDSYTYNVLPSGVEVGSNLAYARIHHFGGEAGRRGHRIHIEARPVLGMNEHDEEVVGQMILGELARLTPGGLMP